MPRYKFSYTVETPLRAPQDAMLTHSGFSVSLGLSRPLDSEHIPASAIAEGENWREANAVAMEDAFGPVLDALSLHKKAPAMLQDLQSVIKAETGTTRRAILIDSHKELHPVNIDGPTIQEVQDALSANTLNRPAFRWLRYSYRPLPVLERFVFAWLAFENFCGIRATARTCPHCGKDLMPLSSVDRDHAFQILHSREPQLARHDFDRSFQEWWREFRSAVLHGGRRLDSALRQRMQDALERFRPAVEDLAQHEVGFRHAYPGTTPNDGFFQTNRYHFVEFGCPTTAEFAETPPMPRFAGRNTSPILEEGVTLLNLDEARDW
jgi:hypothetical protein